MISESAISVAREKYDDFIREAEADRLVKRALAGQPSQMNWLEKLATLIKRWLEPSVWRPAARSRVATGHM